MPLEKMGLSPRISCVERPHLVDRYRAGQSLATIERQTGARHETTMRWVKRFEKTGDVVAQEGGGRPRVTTKETDQEIVSLSLAHREFSTKEIRDRIESPPTPPSVETINRRLLEVGLRSLKPRAKPYLSATHRAKRLRYARRTAKRSWLNVIFSDEKTFYLTNTRSRVRRLKCEEIYCPTVKYPTKVHAYGCFGHGVY